jgi:hypothetical protein
MQNSAWIDLFRRIPPEQHNTLAIVTSVGIEIAIQTLVRIEEHFVVIRGRLAGTTDTGRAFFIPYSQINYLGFVQEIKEPQLRALFGEAPPPADPERKATAASTEPAPAQPAAAEATPAPAPPPEPAPAPPPPPQPGAPPNPAPQLKTLRKSGVLQRLRERAQAGRGTAPPSNP